MEHPMQDGTFKKYLCLGCGFLYDEALGLPEFGISPGTLWADIPEDWVCPDCGTRKELFEMIEIGYAENQHSNCRPSQTSSLEEETCFVLRAAERGYNLITSTGPNSSYVSGHPESYITRASSFNFHEYQGGRHGFGRMRVFGDEAFYGLGCGYNMHPHHNSIICAVVLQGELTHINTLRDIDQLRPGDYYVFSAGSGGKHTEISISGKEMHAIYIWFIPWKLMLPPTFLRGHFDASSQPNHITQLIGDAPGALPIEQDVRVSRLIGDANTALVYTPKSEGSGVYIFVIEGTLNCRGEMLDRRDSMGVWSHQPIACRTGPAGADVLIVESAK
jgi:hypothetical protein